MSLRALLASVSRPVLKHGLRNTTPRYLDNTARYLGNVNAKTTRHFFSTCTRCIRTVPPSNNQTKSVSTYHSALEDELDDDPDKIEVVKHDDTVVIGYHPKKIFDIVMDVGQYKEFVPYCEESTVMSRGEKVDKNGTVVFMRAKLMVYFYGYRIPYTSDVTGYTRYNENRVKAVCYDQKLFDHLEMEWTFSPGPSDDHCKMDFHISFAFNNKTFNWLAGYFKTHIIEQMIPAFIGRCSILHGKPHPLPCLSHLSNMKIEEGHKERHKRRPRH